MGLIADTLSTQRLTQIGGTAVTEIREFKNWYEKTGCNMDSCRFGSQFHSQYILCWTLKGLMLV